MARLNQYQPVYISFIIHRNHSISIQLSIKKTKFSIIPSNFKSFL